MVRGQYVQFGCGWESAPEGWRNFDASPTLRFERLPVLGKLYTKNKNPFPANVEFGDIVKGLPIADNSCDVVYCSHVLEHLALVDFQAALRNTFRMLRPGGLFRMVLPDLEPLAKQYLQDPTPGAAMAFMRESYLGLESRPRGLAGMARAALGNTAHLWAWDFKGLADELEKAGFVRIRRAQFGDSGDPMLARVESQVRWDTFLGADAFKPA